MEMNDALGMDAAADNDMLFVALDDLDKVEVAASLPVQQQALQQRRKALAERDSKSTYHGSLLERKPNKARDFGAGLHNIFRDYFGLDDRPPVHDNADFERRFRVPRTVFSRIYEAFKDQPGFQQTGNATVQPQAHPLQKVVAAIRMLAGGESCDRVDKYVRLSWSTIAVATKQLVQFIVDHFRGEYLLPLIGEEVARVLSRNAQRGLPGCLDSIDCTPWKWSVCPTGMRGMYQASKKTRNVVMEAVCD